jgi:hypothetical protein
MQNELIVSLPKEAMEIQRHIAEVEIIQVVDDDTNRVALENRKVRNGLLRQFDSACEPERLRLMAPVDSFRELKNSVLNKGKEDTAEQDRLISIYNQEIIRKENEMRKLEADRINRENQERIEKENALKILNAEPDKEPELEKVVPIQEPMIIDKVAVKSEGVKAKIGLKPILTITDPLVFMQSAAETGNGPWVKLIYPKWNESKANDFAVALGLNGVDKTFPGTSVQMVPDISSR